MALTREQILKADDLPKREVEIPEWGGSVWVRTMTGAERDVFERHILAAEGSKVEAAKQMRARLVTLTACDDAGARLFNDNGDLDAVSGKSSKALDRVFEVALKLNGLSEKDVDELSGNSSGVQPAGSISA